MGYEVKRQHRDLASGRWEKLSLCEQMANIGSEVSRAIRWRERDPKLFTGAIDRALELIDLTLADPRWRGRRKEICRVREILCAIVLGDDSYATTLEDLDRYFTQFAIAARNKTA